jgi:hypothetical protein
MRLVGGWLDEPLWYLEQNVLGQAQHGHALLLLRVLRQLHLLCSACRSQTHGALDCVRVGGGRVRTNGPAVNHRTPTCVSRSPDAPKRPARGLTPASQATRRTRIVQNVSAEPPPSLTRALVPRPHVLVPSPSARQPPPPLLSEARQGPRVLTMPVPCVFGVGEPTARHRSPGTYLPPTNV